MTTAEYITILTEGALTLVKDNPSETDQATLGTNEYFVLMFCTGYKSYKRNYLQYKGNCNYNISRKVYDIDIDKYAFYQGYYISKFYRKRYNPDRGRTIIVSVSEPAACIDLDDESIMVRGLTDYDDNHYTTVDIEHQQWTIENYKTQHYENGVEIPIIENEFTWLADTTGACCCYDNNFMYKTLRGVLYNYYARVNTNGFVFLKRNGIKEEGWRIPSIADIETLVANTGGVYTGWDYTVTGGKLKETGFEHWDPPNFGATDTYGWKGFGCGNRFIDTFLDQGFRSMNIFADYALSDVMFDQVASFYFSYDNDILIPMVLAFYMAVNVKLVRNI